MVEPLHAPVRLIAELTKIRDADTGHHQERVACYSQILAAEMKQPAEWVAALGFLAWAHDVGKIGIPDAVLLKPGRLTAEEAGVVRSHVTSGAQAIDQLIGDLGLSEYKYAALLRAVVRSHHERWNGTGYPDKLVGAAIPLEARILAVADVFDALTCFRHYRPVWSPAKARSYIVRASGRLFDPTVVKAFQAVFTKLVDAMRRLRTPEELALRGD